MGRQINYYVLPLEFHALFQAVNRPEPAILVPQTTRSTTALLPWDGTSEPPTSAWLIRPRDLGRMRSQDPTWWPARECWMWGAGAFGLEMAPCRFDGTVLHRSRIYFNTLPPVDSETARWANRVISAARRWLVRGPQSDPAGYCGPATRNWLEAGGAWRPW